MLKFINKFYYKPNFNRYSSFPISKSFIIFHKEIYKKLLIKKLIGIMVKNN